MSCQCKDENGQPSDRCYGTCGTISKKAIVQAQEKVSRDPMAGFAELILSQVEKRIAYRMAELTIKFERSQIDLYQKAFKEGLKEGIAIGIDLEHKY